MGLMSCLPCFVFRTELTNQFVFLADCLSPLFGLDVFHRETLIEDLAPLSLVALEFDRGSTDGLRS